MTTSNKDRWRVPGPPRYLVGESLCHCVAFDPLTQPTWRVVRQSTGEFHAYGDHGRLYVGILPDAFKAEGVWHIAAHLIPEQPPVWYMDFGFHTPVELIRAVTVKLAADADSVVEPRPYHQSKKLDDMGAVWQPLSDAGWTLICDDAYYLATSPDEMVTLTYAPSRKGLHALLYPEAWLVEVLPDPDLDPVWSAGFHEETPLHLIAAFTAALVGRTSPIADRNRIPQSRPALISHV